MWCPSVSLSVWANAWLAGKAAPDDVLDALMAWAPTHSVVAYDAMAAGRTGLPWPDMDLAGPMSLLQTVRAAAGPGPLASGRPDRSPTPAIDVLLPVPGDVRGLPPGSQFAADALESGEAMVVSGAGGESIGMVPYFPAVDDDDEQALDGPNLLTWSVYALPGRPAAETMDLGEAEYSLRSAVRSAADLLGGLELAGGGCADPRILVEEVLRATAHHRLPDHTPPRAARVLATAAHVDAIITVGNDVAPIGTQTASEARIADEAIRPLASMVRSARSAAVTAILRSAWSD